MIINEKEAEIIKLIYSNYLKGFGCSSIAKMLTDMQVLSPTGKETWHENTIRHIIRNEKYCGNVIQGKTYTLDAVTHKRMVNNGEEDKYFIKDHHEAIISKEDWERAQEILQTRTNLRLTGRKMSCKFTFSGRFRCGFCGQAYCKKTLYKKRPAWDCVSVIKNGRRFCTESKIIHEDVIKSCFMEAYFLISKDNGLIINEFIDDLRKSVRNNEPQVMKKKVEEEKSNVKARLLKLVDLFVEGKIDAHSYETKQNELRNKLEKIDNKLISLNNMINEDNKAEFGLKKIKTELQMRESSNEIKPFDEELFEALIDYGIVGGYDEGNNKVNYVIRFICKKGFGLRPREDISPETIVENNHLGKEDSIYKTIIDFVSNQNFFVYNDTGNRRIKTLITKVRVRMEIEE